MLGRRIERRWRETSIPSGKVKAPATLREATLSVSIKAFVALLDEGRRFDERYPMLGQVRWLTGGSWSFDDRTATISRQDDYRHNFPAQIRPPSSAKNIETRPPSSAEKANVRASDLSFQSG